MYTHTLLLVLQFDITSLEILLRFLRRVRMKLPFDPGIPLTGLHTKDLKPAYYSDSATSLFIAAQFTITKLGNQPRCPSTYAWINEM